MPARKERGGIEQAERSVVRAAMRWRVCYDKLADGDDRSMRSRVRLANACARLSKARRGK